MRHRNSNKKLNRTSSHRLAMFRNMGNSLILKERIMTTLPKAKELRRIVEPLITLGKTPSLANKRLVFDRTRNREVVLKLFNNLGTRCANRPGGYLRIFKNGFRLGDNAPLALIELVDKEEVIVEEDNSVKKDKKVSSKDKTDIQSKSTTKSSKTKKAKAKKVKEKAKEKAKTKMKAKIKTKKTKAKKANVLDKKVKKKVVKTKAKNDTKTKKDSN